MTHALRILVLEHQNLSRLFDLMDAHIRELGDGQPPDFGLLKIVAEYLSGYLDDVHHPKEDLIFRKLESRDSQAGSKHSRLLVEHREIGDLTKNYAEIVGDSSTASDSTAEQIQEAMKELVALYRHHIEMEETHFFPAAAQILTRGDWAEVNFAVSEKIDPLFDEAVEKYQGVREDIFRLNKEHREEHSAHTLLTEDIRTLAEMTDISRFNQTMVEKGIEAQLEQLANGGYRLTTIHRSVLEIPDCGEARAAWCAYYYLKGTGLQVQ